MEATTEADAHPAREPGPRHGRHKRSRRASALEFGLLVVVALVVALLMRTFLVQAFLVPTISMAPTLEPGDRVVVNKTASGVPSRGQVVVFRNPKYAGEDHGWLGNTWRWLGEGFGFGGPHDAFLVKRVIGLPGESVEVSADGVSIDGQALDEPYLGSTAMGKEGTWDVPDGEVFVMGDNRAHSEDSRYIGAIPVASIVGPVMVRVWPPSRWGRL